MSSLDQTNNSRSLLIEGYRRPYHDPVEARALLLALGQLSLANVWPFDDRSQRAKAHLPRRPVKQIR